MLKLDKIKIISSLKNIQIVNEIEFESNIKEHTILDQKYTLLNPYYLYIELDYAENELVIEFTGKILKDNYPKLITIDTIREALQNINELGICRLDIDGVLYDGEIVKIDVCQDIDYPDCAELTNTLKINVSNFNKYLTRKINNNFVIEKNVQTKALKRRLTVYDKGKEIRLGRNKPFLDCLKDEERVLEYFTGKVRFELNLNSLEQIRQSLHISDTHIDSVLNTDCNPIWEFLDHVLSADETIRPGSSKGDYIAALVLADNNYDLAKVEARMRSFSSPNTHISQVMKPYRAMLERLQLPGSKDLKSRLRGWLMEIVLLLAFVSV